MIIFTSVPEGPRLPGAKRVGGQLTGGVGADVLQVAPLAEVAIPIVPAQWPDGDADGVLREGRQAADLRLAGAVLEGAQLELRDRQTAALCSACVPHLNHSA